MGETAYEYARRIRPDFKGWADENGNLGKGYTVDRAAAAQASPWAAMAMRQSYLERQKNSDALAAQAAGNAAQSRSASAMRGGFSQGMAERQNIDIAKNLLNAQQQLAMQNMMANQETRKADYAQNIQNQQYDIGNRLSNLKAEQDYKMAVYKEQVAARSAQETADAQRSGGCCFIFLEARYGDGTMDAVVRRFRDEHMTDRNRRGYYKVSEVLVPLMRKYKPVKWAVRALMTDPLVAYGKAHYKTGSRLGLVFKPLKDFWLRTFDFIGGDHEFVRENGETV